MRSPFAPGRFSTRFAVAVATFAVLVSMMPVATVLAAKAAVSLEQCRNGAASGPNNCEALGGSSGWVNGNVGGSQGHLLEGYSIPYRAIMTDIPTGSSITLVLGYDIKHGGVNALDYLTHYQRLLPHGVFGHAAETVDPWDGVNGLSGTITTFAIPTPDTANSPVPGQPATSFGLLPATERVMTLNGGTIANVAYTSQGDLTASQSETRIAITFTADSSTAVLAWGGHIARGDEWNGASASAISGSPYHMRAKGWNLGNVGNQDRSLSADAVINPPKLIVIKQVINDNGGTAVASDFTMDVSGGASPASFPGAESPGTTVLFPDNATYAVTESGPSGCSATFSADCSGSIAVEETKTCTVTNDDIAPQLIVIKNVINDNGGTAVAADFTLDSGGTNDTPDNFAGAESPGTTVTLDAGAYNVTETGPSGYAASFSTDCSGTIAVGETKTCTVTNSDIGPRLIVIKHVINDNGGTATAADFTLDSGGTNDTPDDFAGAEDPGTTVTLDAGSYNVTETGPSGYSASFSADCSGTIAVGEVKTCTVTNDDIAPQLIVIKHVVNDNGGTATAAEFTLDSGGANDTPDDFAGEEAPGTTVTLDAGSYNVTESGPSGYTASFSADCSGSIGVGETKTCTVTNNDVAATLIVIKHVVNDNGGTAVAANFTLDSGGTNDTPDNFAGEEAPGTVVSLDAGTYNVSESGPSGYTASFSADCSGSIAVGETKTCTVTNDDTKNDPTGTTTMSWILKDSADFTIRAGAADAASATMTFRLYSDATPDCGTQIGIVANVAVTLSGGGAIASAATAAGIAVSSPGTYFWRAFYSGDNFNNPASTACGTEVTTISVP